MLAPHLISGALGIDPAAVSPLLGTALAHDPFSSSLAQAIVLLALIRFLDLWERQPIRLVVAFALWGAFGATAIAYLA